MTAATLAIPQPRTTCRATCVSTDTREAERLLLVRYHEEGDIAAREELCERFLPLARDLALRYSYTDEPIDDLFQVASLGLVKAIDRFEPGRGSKFTSYAAPTILGELKRHFRDKGWSLHVPRDLQERTLAVSRASEVLSKELGRSPKVREVARVHGEDQVIPGQPGRLELPSPVRLRARAVVAPAGQRRPRVRIHRVADVPVAGARAVHHDRAVQAGRAQFGAQHGLGHRRPADVAQADQADPVRGAGFARGRQLSR